MFNMTYLATLKGAPTKERITGPNIIITHFQK